MAPLSVGFSRCGGSRLFGHDLVDHRGKLLAGVRLLAGEHFEGDHRERELVERPSTACPCTCSGDM
jgi:hypothetical protein